MYTVDVVTLSVFPKNIFNASNPTASSAFSIVRAVNRQLASKPVGNTVAFLNNTLPLSIHIVPPAAAASQSTSADDR
ncbi:hypothetical protein EDD18DRAFT_1358670 [Armillaria luteobubalina]|uniref:Uncharacterized protein n=1 Tax=Armillaria luteobubalina TaxID=153913 RepID=A0AA39PT52_9AGAR|nr:hypothetical protein EDD18DRAFT_1358670 [Armillaria luteobubalina]